MLLVFVIFYMLVTLLIGWWASRRVKNTQDFIITGRKLPLLIAASGANPIPATVIGENLIKSYFKNEVV